MKMSSTTMLSPDQSLNFGSRMTCHAAVQFFRARARARFKYALRPGAFPGFGMGPGAKKFFFSDLEICMTRSEMLRIAKPCSLLRGFGGMPPREDFF